MLLSVPQVIAQSLRAASPGTELRVIVQVFSLQVLLLEADSEAAPGRPRRRETLLLPSLLLQQPTEGLAAATLEDAHG